MSFKYICAPAICMDPPIPVRKRALTSSLRLPAIAVLPAPTAYEPKCGGKEGMRGVSMKQM